MSEKLSKKNGCPAGAAGSAGGGEAPVFDAEGVSKIISVVLLCTIMTNMATSIYIKGLSDALVGQIVVWAACVFLLLQHWTLVNQLRARTQSAEASEAAMREQVEDLRRRLARLESAKK